ncbi:MAG: thermopsin [Thermoplasmata archaeon]|nr:thermopsin [Thermoplasmata archaeon]
MGSRGAIAGRTSAWAILAVTLLATGALASPAANGRGSASLVVSPGASPIHAGMPVVAKGSGHASTPAVRATGNPMLHPRLAAPPSATTTRANPGCSTSPCAMGITDFGLTASLGKYSYNTQMVESFADISKLTVTTTGAGGCLDSNAASCVGFQSNWVDKGVEVKNRLGSYWTQDVAQLGYDSSCSSPCVSGTYSVTWLDNIWNFSYSGGICPSGSGLGCMNSGDVTGNGKGACTSTGGAPTFYYCVGPTVYDLSMPFSIWTFMSTGPGTVAGPCGSITANACVDFYGAVIENNSYAYGAYYDSVNFTAGSKGALHPSWRVADINAPYGLPYDGEWLICGSAGGGTATLGSASVLMETEYWVPTTSSWVSIRHAWSSGADTGESVTNVNVFAFAGFRDVASAVAGTENPQVSLW